MFIALTGLWARSAPAQVLDWPEQRPPRPLPARDVNFPDYQLRTLKNGLQVIAVSHHEQPAVSLRLLVRAGGAQDPTAKPGVASFAAGLLDQGTSTRNAEQIATTIDSIGGAISTGSSSDWTIMNAVVMKDSFNLALELVSDIARNPAFDPEEIERRRQQVRSGLQVSYDDPDYLAGVVFDRLVFGFHPYGKPDSGTPASLANIQRSDLVAFHKSWFGANNAILAIVGDVTADEAFAGAERAFGGWGRSEQTVIAPVDPPPPTRRVVIVDRPGAVQTEIRAGNIALPRKHPDYMALNLAMRILGGEGGNRLHRVLRSERGLTYGASAEMHAMKDSGNIVADTDTRSETTAETLRLLVDELWRLQRQRVSQRELSEAQAYLTGSFPLTIETPSAIALQVLNNIFYGLDLGELENFRERVNGVTVDDIQRVAQRYLHPDRLSIVLVGDASVFAQQLAGLGFDQVERIPLADLDLTSPDLRRGPPAGPRFAPLAATFTASAFPPRARETTPQTDVQDLITRAIRAKGGLERLRGIRTVKAVADVTVDNGAQRVTAPTTTLIRYPSAFRVDLMTSKGRLVQVFNDGDYWVEDARGVRQAPSESAAEMRANIQRDVILLLLGLADGRLRATRAPDVVEHGRALPALEIAGGGMRPVTLVIDPATGLVASQRYVAHADGDASTEEAFSDYRDVKGVKVAFKAVVRRRGAPIVERVVRSYQYNVPLDNALFTRPI